MTAEVDAAIASHPVPGTIIGTPYAGTHAKAFNISGGTDNWQSENAVDIYLHPGTRIVAMEAGTISPDGWGYGDSGQGGRMAGSRVHLKMHVAPFMAYYTHMRKLVVNRGDVVTKGQLIGYSGIANGVPHLHFAVPYGYDPELYYKNTYSFTVKKSGTDPAGKHTKIATNNPPIPPSIKREITSKHGNVAAWGDFLEVFANDLPFAMQHTQNLGADLMKVVK